MKKICLFVTTFLILATSLFAQNVIIDEKLDQPTGLTYNYPPNNGEKWTKFSPNLAGWAVNEGKMEITYADKLGINNSGGLTCKVAAATQSRGFLSLNCENIKIQVSSAEEIEAAIKSLEFDFAIKVPTGKVVNMFFQASETIFPADPALKADFKLRAYPSRANLPKVLGNDEYTKYTVKCADLPQEEITKVSEFVAECYKNGALEINLALSWLLSGDQWSEGEEFSIDEIKVVQNK